MRGREGRRRPRDRDRGGAGRSDCDDARGGRPAGRRGRRPHSGGRQQPRSLRPGCPHTQHFRGVWRNKPPCARVRRWTPYGRGASSPVRALAGRARQSLARARAGVTWHRGPQRPQSDRDGRQPSHPASRGDALQFCPRRCRPPPAGPVRRVFGCLSRPSPRFRRLAAGNRAAVPTLPLAAPQSAAGKAGACASAFGTIR